MQQEIVRTLKQIDTDIRDFTKCLEPVTSEKSLDEQRQCEKRLGDLKNAVTAHRSQICAWASRFGANLPSKDRLLAARRRIDQELRRCQEFEKNSKLAAASERFSKRLNLSTGNSAITKYSTNSLLPYAEKSVESEVKIMSDQLCAEDIEETNMAREFVCQICLHVVGRTPQLSSCSHVFCGDCIAMWIDVQPKNQSWARRASLGGAVPCPICKEPLQKDADLHAVTPESDGGSAVLWQMLCGLKVMCANHSGYNSEGNCTWTGDYGSYQEHIRCCANIPMPQCENNTSNQLDIPHVTLDIVNSSSDVKADDSELEIETTASEISDHDDSESSCDSERADLENTSETESARPLDHPEDSVPSAAGETDLCTSNPFEEPAVTGENNSWTVLRADSVDPRAAEDSQGLGSLEDVCATVAIEFAATDEATSTRSVLNSKAVPFKPASEKEAAWGLHGCQSSRLQAAAWQYQETQVQMAQIAYLHNVRSFQMAQYQAAYVQARVNQMRLA